MDSTLITLSRMPEAARPPNLRAAKGERVPAAPFRPKRFQVFPVGTARQTRRNGKVVRYWAVRGWGGDRRLPQAVLGEGESSAA